MPKPEDLIDDEVIIDPDDVESIIRAHIGVAKSIAYRVWGRAPRELEKEDILQLAYEGLTQAAQRWKSHCEENAHKGYDYRNVKGFPYFSRRRIEGNIYDNLRIDDPMKRSIRATAKLIQNADQGLGLTEREIAEKAGLSVEEVHYNNYIMSKKAVSLDSGILEVYEPQTADVASTAESNRLLDIAVSAIVGCTYEQQIILALHYFLNKDFKYIAKKMGIPEQHASKLHTEAIMAVYETMKLETEDY
jgi:RNA polymerase sigma factor for flagellar operon FliA